MISFKCESFIPKQVPFLTNFHWNSSKVLGGGQGGRENRKRKRYRSQEEREWDWESNLFDDEYDNRPDNIHEKISPF